MKDRTYRRRMILALFLVALVAIPALGTTTALGAPRRVTQVTIKEFPSKLVIGIVATGQLLYHMTEMVNLQPPRVALDLLDAVVDTELRTSTEINRGNVLRVRVGQFQQAPPIARIVIDFVRPVPVELQRTAPNILVASVPQLRVTETAAKGIATPLPAKPEAPRAPVTSAPVETALGTGVVKTAQAPTAPQAPGVIKLLEFRGVALGDVLTALAKLCGFNLVTDTAVQGAISLRLVDVTCEEALRFILEANNLAFRRLKRNIIVSSAEKLAPPPEVPETVSYRLSFGDVNQIRAAVAAAVPGVRVAVDPRTSALLITGTSAQQEEVVKVLASLDVRIPQVVIQVHAIETNMDVLRDLGLFGGLGPLTTTSPSGTSPLTVTSPGASGAPTIGGGFLDNLQNRIGFTLVNTSLFFLKLDALVTERKSRILSAPRLATLDGNKASLVMGEKIPIFTSTTTGSTTTVTVTFVDVGVKLDFTPKVNAGGLITLGIKPEVSSLVSIVTFSGSQAPRVSSRTADTTVTVKDGDTIVIAGLITRTERQETIKIPVLGDIPILGELFRHVENQATESEVLFLITPQVVQETAP